MSDRKLPSKVQIGDEVTLEIGTPEKISAEVTAIKFTHSSVSYDLHVNIGEDKFVEWNEVPSALVSAIEASEFQEQTV